MSTKSFQTEFIFTQKSGKSLANTLSNISVNNESIRIKKTVKFVDKKDIKTINSVLKDFN